jgi:CCR4-NOT transcription complex subunit 2
MGCEVTCFFCDIKGLHNMHGNYSIANMSGSLAQRNAAISGLPSSGVQQPGGSMPGRFTANNLPVAMSQVCDAHLYEY